MRFISLALISLAAIVTASPVALQASSELNERDLQLEAENRVRAARYARRAASTDPSDIAARAGVYDPIILHTLCSSTAMCLKYARGDDVPVNGALVCQLSNKHCVQKCNGGYTLKDGKCLKPTSACGNVKCPAAPANGVYTCIPLAGFPSSVPPKCVLNCKSGFSVSGSTCVNTQTSIDNCGRVGNACPKSYNGLGARTCSNGACGLNCGTSGLYTVQYTKSGRLPFCSSRTT